MPLSKHTNAFRELSERNHARWMGIARSYADDSQREDLLQEIMMQVWKSLDGFEGRSSIDTWAYRVALNTALAWGRTSQKRSTNLKTIAADVGHLAGGLESDSLEMRVLDEFPEVAVEDRSRGDVAVPG